MMLLMLVVYWYGYCKLTEVLSWTGLISVGYMIPSPSLHYLGRARDNIIFIYILLFMLPLLLCPLPLIERRSGITYGGTI